jgi:predicted N-formylglutamate amidohydrolase
MFTKRPGVVISCEHAGNRVPPGCRGLFRGHRAELESHRGFDPGALALARVLACSLEAPLVATTVSRLVVECNRSPDHPRLFSEFTRALPRDEKRRILERHYHPHRGAVEAVVRSALRTHGCVVHVGVHTFTPVLAGRVRNADVGLLCDPRRASEVRLCEEWTIRLALAAPALHVRRNYPYRGWTDGLTTTLRGKFGARRYLGLELEVNQRLVKGAGWKEVTESVAESLRLLLGPPQEAA